MKQIFYITFFACALFACNGNKSNSTDANLKVAETISLDNPYVSISGEFSGKWLVKDKLYTLINLALKADSTFSLIEQNESLMATPVNGNLTKQEAALESTGKFLVQANGAIVILNFNEASRESLRFSYADNKLIKLGGDVPSGKIASDNFTLYRNTKVVGTLNNFLVNYETKAFTRYPVQVFLWTAANNVKIHKPYLDVAPENEKALIAYYCMRYNTGCDEVGCALTTALGMNEDAQKEAVVKWMPQVEGAKAAVNNPLPAKERERLTMLFLLKTPRGFSVNYTLLTSKDENIRNMEDFELVDGTWKLNKETKREVLKSK